MLYTDTTFTEIHDNGMLVYVTHINSEGNDETLQSITIYSLTDPIEIPIGQIMRGYQHGSIGTYDGLRLKMGERLYNYSRLKIRYDPDIPEYNPRLNLMYTE